MKNFFSEKFFKFLRVLFWCLYIIISLMFWLTVYYTVKLIEFVSHNKDTKLVLFAEKKLEELRDSTTRLSVYFIAG